MRNLLVRGLEQINNDLIEMGTLIEIAIKRAITALRTRDIKLAKSVSKYQKQVDEMEKHIERAALQILVSQQPVARDMRLVSSSLKLITDMQRIADQASNIAEITIQLAGSPYVKSPQRIVEMSEKTIDMVNNSIDAFVNRNKTLAEEVILADDEVDALFVVVRDELINLINEDKRNGEQAIDLIMIAKYLERISDHAVNICRWVIFFITGEHLEVIEEGEEDLNE